MNYEGIIMVLSCQKYINTRCINNNFNSNVNNWLLIKVIGNFLLNEEYIFDASSNILTVKCEDSYLHLLKKRILAIKHIKNIFNFNQGILCCGDDVNFNEDFLVKYLNKVKNDYEGQAVGNTNDYIANDKNKLKNCINDLFMYNYYYLHPEDLSNPMHNLKNITLDYLKNISKRPNIYGAGGTIFYLSNYSCNILINHMKKINYNIFHFDEFTNSYPYLIEDCAISFILYFYNINFTNLQYFFTHTNNKNFICKSSNITWHTGKDLIWRY